MGEGNPAGETLWSLAGGLVETCCRSDQEGWPPSGVLSAPSSALPADSLRTTGAVQALRGAVSARIACWFMVFFPF
jgi:hypothetical protein